MPSRSARAGFALIELVVAIAITGLVLLGARSMLEQLADGADDIHAAATSADRTANADRVLRGLLGSVVAASEVSGAVAGDHEEVRLATWCEVPAGWQERCQVALSFEFVDSGRALVAMSSRDRLVLRAGFEAGSLLYLIDPRGGGTWLPAWRSRLTTPLALGVVLDGDTLILRIGERG